jgi:hypothetical protein
MGLVAEKLSAVNVYFIIAKMMSYLPVILI